VPIVQISRIQHRRGKATDLPQLAAGELGWVIDEQKLYIGNGTVADGAPAVGNTEILTSGSSAFSSALKYVYRGYLGDATPIVTGDGVDVLRTLQQRLDDYVSVKAFGAVGDGSTDDTDAIQRALEELYSDVDQNDTHSSRILFFPAGTYKISTSLRIPPYARLSGEGIDGSVIYQLGGNCPVAVTEDNSGNTFSTEYGLPGGGINDNYPTVTRPTQITVEGIQFWNAESYPGFSIDCATNVRFVNCGFKGTYAAGGNDNSNSLGITVRSTSVLSCRDIIFDSCQFTKFARLVDLSYDVTSIKFINCTFTTALYGAYIGDTTGDSTNGLQDGPSNIQFLYNTWGNSTNSDFAIGRNAIKVVAGGTIRNIVSVGNWFGSDIGNDFSDYNTTNNTYSEIDFDTDECISRFDYFARSDLRSTSVTPAININGVGIIDSPIKQITLADNTSSATTTGIRIAATSGSALTIKYKIERGSDFRTGVLTVIGKEGTTPTYNDDYEETADIGVTLSVTTDDLDSTAGNETFVVKYITTSTGSSATMDYQNTIIA
jgi:hypothetical protein